MVEIVVRDVRAEVYENETGEGEGEDERIEGARSRVRDCRAEEHGDDARGEEFRPELLYENGRFAHTAHTIRYCPALPR